MLETVTVRGSGGAEFVVDIPAEGTPARARFDRDVAEGAVAVVQPVRPAKKPVTAPKE